MHRLDTTRYNALMTLARVVTVAGFLCAAMHLTSRAQSLAPSTGEFIAFRFDDTHVIAVVKSVDDRLARPKADRVISARPAAQYGFPYFDAPPELAAHVPATIQSARWVIHAAPGQVFEATAENVVAGAPGCSGAVGVRLAVAPAQAQQFARASARYFVAEAQVPARSIGAGPQSAVRSLPPPAFTAAQKSTLESVLNALLARELPAIQTEAAADIDRMARSDVSYHRSWAVTRRRVDQQLSEGDVTLTYDVQALQLDPGGTPIYFVRAQWLAGRDQAFAASAWLRGDRFEIVQSTTRPSSWLRMFEFQGRIDTLQLGLVLNVLDRDRDGWGEVIFAGGGYESVGLDVQEWSPSGFVRSGIDYSYGC
jgi:hypothetical protein